MTCKLAPKSIPNHENNYIATQNYYDQQLLFAYKIAGDVLLFNNINVLKFIIQQIFVEFSCAGSCFRCKGYCGEKKQTK